jgi:hypothetical protein
MGRLVLASALLLLAAAGDAYAGPTRKVQVESEPPGASVYIDDIDAGAACESTPCEISVPLGSHTLIVRLDKYEPEVVEVDVVKGKRPLQQSIKLKSAIATIKVDSPRGATVRIDDEDKGKAPIEITTSAAEPHHVVVSLSGKSVFDDIVEVATGDIYPVKPKMASASTDDSATVTDDDGEGGGGGGGSGGGTGGSTGITDSTESGPRSAYVSGGVAFDIGFRHFTYQEAMTNNLREETEGGQVMGGPAVELWPGRMLGVGPLHGMSLFARLQFPISGQTVEGGDLMGTVQTEWSSFEASLRQRWVFGSFGIEASGGYVQDVLTFKTSDSRDLDKMPDANYQSIRLGGKLAYQAGSVEPYLAAENRIVMSGGVVGQRFEQSKCSGLRGSLGLGLAFGAFTARAEGTLMSYSWQFAYEPGAPAQAKSATDSIRLISMTLAYSY